MGDTKLGVLLACFSEHNGAGKARRPLDGKLRSAGDVVLDTVVMKVNKKHKASVHDPRRVLMATLTPALTWGLFGLVANGWVGLLIWGLLGAICGGPYAYYALHHASKAELRHIGKHLPSNASALLTFAETKDPGRLLAASAADAPSVSSVADIADDLSARVSVAGHGGSAGASAATTMIMLRYPKAEDAREAAGKLAAQKNGKSEDAEVELVIRSDPDGKRHVADPKFGVAAMVKTDIVTWGAFGLVVGAISGASGGGILEGGLVTGIAWAVFGVFAGTLFGLWAGRSTSARRLKGVGPILAPGTSILLAWADGAVSRDVLDALGQPDSQRLVLHFNPVSSGAVLEAG